MNAMTEIRRQSSLSSIGLIYQRYRKSILVNDFGVKAWRLSYLKEQFVTLNLEDYYQKYTQKVKHGYYSLFLILQFCMSLMHFVLVLVLNANNKTLDLVIPDIFCYALATILAASGLISTEIYVKNRPKIIKKLSMANFALLFFINLFPPVYHHFVTNEELRSTYTTQFIIACYIFFIVESTKIAAILGVFVSLSQLITVLTVTYSSTDDWETRFSYAGSDLVFYICINMMGWYFRYMNEIVQRRGFLDRKKAVDTNIRLEDEKKQEDELMLAIIPETIIKEVRMQMQIRDTGFNDYLQISSFDDRFIKFHENVTILYADIVNYTQMTTKLTPVSRLVETLNDLFGTFDDASEELNVLRIKFLGDCYYCVSGLVPDKKTNHAEACVDLGLRMIKIIKKVSESRDLQIDMRIGIHTGNTLSGIIGLAKWQYDIWSKDVYIANKMESSGLKGKVHITKQTKDQLRKQYNIVPTDAAQDDDYLRGCNLETFFISPEPIEENFIKIQKKERATINMKMRPLVVDESKRASTLGVVKGNKLIRQLSVDNFQTNRGTVSGRRSANTSIASRRRTGFMDQSISRFLQREGNAAKELDNAIESMHLSKFDQWFKNKDISSLFLVFRTFEREISYILLPDPLFKNNIIVEILILACVIILQYVAIPKWHDTTLLSIVTIIFLLILLPICWTQYVYHTYFRKVRDEDTQGSVENASIDDSGASDLFDNKSKPLRIIYNISREITQNAVLRTVLYCVLCTIFSLCIVIELQHCAYDDIHSVPDSESKCISPWNITQLCCLAIILSFLFLKIHVWLKFIFATIVTAIYSDWIWNSAYDYFEHGQSYNYSMDAALTHIVTILNLSFTLHLIDRQSDYMHRLDHIWNEQLERETKKAQETHDINRSLLENIVPIHVAENYFSASNRRGKLYYEEYANVAVMFASIINFNFDDFTDREFLNIMNRVILAFDQVLLKKYRASSNRCVEKIKIANLTYMACCGLTPGKGDLCEGDDLLEFSENVVTLVNFAVDLRKALLKINEEYKLDFKLRIGICNGEVTAGVVGQKKPHYDIWGDTVNMASRMDSTGRPDQIQVTEQTAVILDDFGILCDYNGLVFVKGKSLDNTPDVPTYFVVLDSDNNLVQKPVTHDMYQNPSNFTDEAQEEVKRVSFGKISQSHSSNDLFVIEEVF